MIKVIIILGLIVFSIDVKAQCNLPYFKETFSKIKYYKKVDKKLKLTRSAYSRNTFEIFNSSITEQDLIALTGNFVEKYVMFVNEYGCNRSKTHISYEIRVSDNSSMDIWIVSVSFSGKTISVSNIRNQENLVIEFSN